MQSKDLGSRTEADWMGADPRPMLELLCGHASERKLRLFAAACCRRIGYRLCWVYQDVGVGEYDWDRVLVTSERFADGAATGEELRAAAALAERVDDAEAWQSEGASAAATAIAVAVTMRPRWDWARETGRTITPQSVAIEAALQASSEAAFAEGVATAVARAAQAELLREIFGNPFRSRHIPREWRTRNSSTVVELAQAIYDDRAFDRLPLLADALEGEGYGNPEVLDHCRRLDGHVRGCWVVDLMLGKQ